MSIAVIITDRNTDALCENLRALLPSVMVQQWPDIPHPEMVSLAVLWAHPDGITDTMPQLKCVVSMGAGMDHIEQDHHIDKGLIKHRVVTLALKQNMAQYILQYVLNDHRQNRAYQQQQSAKKWQVLEQDKQPCVGFLGLGALGSFVADQCKILGFNTMAWTQKQNHPSHPCYHGSSGLREVCCHSDYLVVLLPLTASTKHIINQQTLSWCQPNAVLINVGRGEHVNEADLLEALEQATIKQAVLDVFNQEPLPPEHPFWLHPKVILTPHSSARSDVKQTAKQIAMYHRSIV